MSGRPVSGASSVFTLLPITRITACTLPPVRSATVLDSQISGNLAVNHALEGSRLCAPCENLMPDDFWLEGFPSASRCRQYILPMRCISCSQGGRYQGAAECPSSVVTLPTKVCLVKAMVFPVVMYGCESWTVNKIEC